jgi:hypothetical protein
VRRWTAAARCGAAHQEGAPIDTCGDFDGGYIVSLGDGGLVLVVMRVHESLLGAVLLHIRIASGQLAAAHQDWQF